MAEKTAIEWCDHTFNPWEGCQKISPGCDNCYAEARNVRFGGGTAANWGPGAPRRRTSAANWKLPLKWNQLSEQWVRNGGPRTRVFCASLADVFDNDVAPAWRADLFDLIRRTPHLDWLLLTKRIGNAWKLMADACGVSMASLTLPWHNVWLGATVVSQEEFDRDVPKLMRIPAARRFLSLEPMLGPVDLGLQCENWSDDIVMDPETGARECCKACDYTGIGNAIDWVICGGESGPNARPMHPGWVRSLRDQCAAAGVPFLFKQWGEWTPGENVERQRGTVDTAFLWGDEWSIHPLNLATDHGHIDDQPDLYRVGKKAAGRLLDGRLHNEFPAP